MQRSRCSAALVLFVAMSGVASGGEAQSIFSVAPADAFRGLPDVTFQYYDVYGSDEASISESLNRNAPTRPDGSKAMGATGYKTGFRPFQVGDGAACKVTKLQVRVSAVVILPRLRDESAVPAGLLARWRGFVAGLREHEAGHVRIEYEHMRGIEAALIGSRCDQIQARFQAATDRIATFQQAYDRKTNHGDTQGATLR